MTDNADRNWAAEFGYGKTESSISASSSRPAGDLLLKMRSKFQQGDEEEDEDEVRIGGTLNILQ